MTACAPSAATPSRSDGVAHRRGDVRSGRPAELDRGGPDAACGAVDEQALAHAEAGLGEERVVRGGEHLGDAARLRPVDALRDGRCGALVDDAQLGLPPAADDGHDAVALGEALGAGTARHDLACELEAGDVGRRPGRRGVAARALVQVGAVDPGRADADEDLPRPGLGIGLLVGRDLVVGDDRGEHGGAV